MLGCKRDKKKGCCEKPVVGPPQLAELRGESRRRVAVRPRRGATASAARYTRVSERAMESRITKENKKYCDRQDDDT
eukprot:6193004-Pleurochrysis_carterae.AAC.9